MASADWAELDDDGGCDEPQVAVHAAQVRPADVWHNHCSDEGEFESARAVRRSKQQQQADARYALTPVTAASKHEAEVRWQWIVQFQGQTDPARRGGSRTQAVMQLAIDVHNVLKRLSAEFTYYEIAPGRDGKRGKTRELWPLQELTELFLALAEQRHQHPTPRASTAVSNALYTLYKEHTKRYGVLHDRVPTLQQRKERDQRRKASRDAHGW